MLSLSTLAAAGLLLLGLAPQVSADPIFVGYYPTWKAKEMKTVDLKKYTHVNIAFAAPLESGAIVLDKSFDMASAVKQIHDAGAKALLSIGGWSGSQNISYVVSNPSSGSRMMNDLFGLIEKHSLDGVDIDWEHPGRQGAPQNRYDAAHDTPNFLEYLGTLRAQIDAKFKKNRKLVTLAVATQPFYVDGSPAKDVSKFAKLVDYAHLMLYDMNGPWGSTTGPNAPLDPGHCANNKESFSAAIDAWICAGWPPGQLTAGFAFYGRAMAATLDMSQKSSCQYQDKTKEAIKGDVDDTVTPYSGMWQWKHLRGQGILTTTNTTDRAWKRYWDTTTTTPWLFNNSPNNLTYISYDDTFSILLKVLHASSRGLAGAMVWSADMDYRNELIDAQRQRQQRCHGGGGGYVTNDGPKPSSSAPAGGSSPGAVTTDGGESGGGGGSSSACTNGVLYTCDKPGVEPGYTVCLYGRPANMQCSAGTVCIAGGSSLSYGYGKGS
ncbi:hypothetical protein H4R18_005850 [Coemansia javaensis]|uniref:GH18 domain-containing protein n=1 Tax=Coemansia javaensis TaxID=2761396 RepID=A0A9W8H1Y0_9FUNG|nr:hypothetical protein H4R18_005850 [Coemansia javaensis]